MSKPKGIKTLRKPPSETNMEDWIKKGKAPSTQHPDNPGTQSPDNSGTQDADNAKPSGPGIVKRADGTYRRRLVVYLDPDQADQLKMHAVLTHRDMSDIVDELVGEWLASNASTR